MVGGGVTLVSVISRTSKSIMAGQEGPDNPLTPIQPKYASHVQIFAIFPPAFLAPYLSSRASKRARGPPDLPKGDVQSQSHAE